MVLVVKYREKRVRRGEHSERRERKERKKEKPVTGNVQCRNVGASIPMIIITIIHLHTYLNTR